MADGFTGGPPDGPGSTELRGAAAAIHWLTHSREGRLTILIALAIVALGIVTAWHAFGTPILNSPDAKAWFVAGTGALWFPLLLLLLDAPDNMAKGPRLTLPMVTLGLLASLAAFTTADTALGLQILTGDNGVKAAPLVAFFAFLALALLPRVASAVQFTMYKDRDAADRARDAAIKRAKANPQDAARADQLDAQVREQNDAESLGAVIATLAVIGIGLLAFFAGGWTQGSSLRSAVGVGISIGVVGLFAVVVFLDWIAEFAPIRMASRAMRGFSKRMSWLASFYNTLDAALVRIGAHVAGTEHHKARSRYTILAGTLGCLGVMAFFLPAPYGLIPAIIGFILAISVSRLWSWVEDDRNLALITRFNPDAPKKVGFREDFKDETLLGFIFVLVLIPVAMMQADKSKLFGVELFAGAGKDQFTAWLGYFGFELAKALPVVDWADIYNLKAGDDLLKPNGAVGMHAVFAARATVDLVLIAALLQAIGIATRNRQQKSLYAAEQIDRLDELVEREELRRAMNQPTSDWFKGPIDFRKYNQDRLKELYHGNPDNDQLREFIRTIFTKGGWNLDPAIVALERIASTHQHEDQLYLTFEAVKREFSAGRAVPVGDFMDIMESLKNKAGLEKLKANILAFATRAGSASEVLDMTMPIMIGGSKDRFLYAREAAANALTTVSPNLPDPQTIADAIADVEEHRVEIFGNNRQHVGDKLLDALRKRLSELQPKAPIIPDSPQKDGPTDDQNKP